MENKKTLWNMKEYAAKQFRLDANQFAAAGKIQSGYANLDAITNLYPGLYVIGAISSLGKTTFMHQMAENIAASGTHVLYCTFEQTALELMSKSCARALRKQNEVKTSLQIRRNLDTLDADSLFERMDVTLEHLHVYDGKMNTCVEDIAEAVRDVMEQTKATPVVIIDYLQLLKLKNSSKNKKEDVDTILSFLKNLQKEHFLTVIVISSLNRQNYMTPIDFESFKESGGIEYSADVLWGLQLQVITSPDFLNLSDIASKRKRLAEAKSSSPREIRLVCVKNRFGPSYYHCDFLYYPESDYFIPDCDGDFTKNCAEDTDGFVKLPAGAASPFD